MSTAEQQDGYSLGHQIDACRTYAAARGWTVVAEITDAGVGGGVPLADRPGGAAVIEAMTTVGAVVALRLDRLVRSIRVWCDLVDTAAGAGCAVVTADGAFDLATSHGRLVASMLAAVAAFERDLISERTREGLAAARAAGVRLGQRPHREATLDLVAGLMADGLGCRRITAALNDRAARRPDGGTAWTLGATRGAMRAATDAHRIPPAVAPPP